MPITQSAKKKLRRDQRKTEINRLFKKKLKAAIKAMRQRPTAKKYRLVSSLLDQAAKKHLVHQNKAARLKSRLQKRLQ